MFKVDYFFDTMKTIFQTQDAICSFFPGEENSFTGSIAFPSRFHNIGIIALRITKGNRKSGYRKGHKGDASNNNHVGSRKT
jgi:hypothetical protein